MANQNFILIKVNQIMLALFLGITLLLCMCKGEPIVERLPPDDDMVYPTSVTAKEMITGTGGYDYGKLVSNSMHTQMGVNCMNNCHRAPTMEWPDSQDAETYILISDDGKENVEVCNKCHPPAVGMGLHSFNFTRFNRAPIKDYDGDGTAEGVQDEVNGLLDVLLQAIKESGVTSLDTEPFWENVSSDSQKLAIYNWSFVNHDPSRGVHNTARAVQLLQLSYEDLTGKPVPGATLYTPVPGPKVEPSLIVIEPVLKIDGLKDRNGKPVKTTSLPNVGVGSYVLLKGFKKDTSVENPVKSVKWSLVPPEGSKAVIKEVNKEYAYFIADQMAWYEVKLVIIDSTGTTTGGLRIHAAPYVGIGSVDGDEGIGPECSSCHPAGSKEWAETAHARAFAKAIDGGDNPAKSNLQESDLVYYTLGYNPDANNNGFDEVAVKTGWTFPKPGNQKPGNWDTMPLALKQFASVQCESCHGPGGRWVAASISLRSDACGYCHDSSLKGNIYEQWIKSGHADYSSPAFTHDFGENTACLVCHDAEAFIDLTAGKKGSLRRYTGRVGNQPVTCAVCHDPHNAFHESSLRVSGLVILPDGTEVDDTGASTACMMCHNGRVAPDQVDAEKPAYPHHSTAGEMMAGAGGYDYGKELKDSPHTSMGLGCVDCHMASGKSGTGGHTFSMVSDSGVENIDVCNTCHSHLTTFNREINKDFDGDGTAKGVREEIDGLLKKLHQVIRESGVEVLRGYPYWSNVTTRSQKAAIYNYTFVNNDRSLGVHNTTRTVQLLQRSYKDLTGNDVPGADLL